MSLPCLILGGGGHARVVIDALRASGSAVPCGIVDAAEARWGQMVDGVEILGGDDQLPRLLAAGVTHFVMGLAGAGNNQPRRRLFEAAQALGFRPLQVVHPSAVISPTVRFGEGVQVLVQAVINAGAVIGTNVIVNTAAIIEHDCVIAAHVHLASRATLAGNVRVEEGAHLGAGCVVRQGCVIGGGAIVGAGAAVVENVPANMVVAGVPAVILKPC